MFARDERGGIGLEHDEAPVGAQARAEADAVGLRSGGRDADTRHRCGQAIANEHIVNGVRVAGHEVRGSRSIRNEAPIGADRRIVAEAVRLRAVMRDGDAFRGPGCGRRRR